MPPYSLRAAEWGGGTSNKGRCRMLEGMAEDGKGHRQGLFREGEGNTPGILTSTSKKEEP